MCLCIIYNLFLLKTSVDLNISLLESQQAQIAAMSADSEAFGSLNELLADRELTDRNVACISLVTVTCFGLVLPTWYFHMSLE